MKEVKGIGSALYLSDGYMNLALIKKTPELKVDEGLYHFGFEVEDVESLKDVLKQVGASSEVHPSPEIVTLNSGFTIQMETPLILYARGSGLYRNVTPLEKAFFVHRVAVATGAGHPNELAPGRASVPTPLALR